MVKFLKMVPNKGNEVKQQVDNISKICQKYLNENENINLFEYYKNVNYTNRDGYNEINKVLTETFEKIGEKYFGEVQTVNDTLETFAEKFEIELEPTDSRDMIKEIAQKENEIRNHQNYTRNFTTDNSNNSKNKSLAKGIKEISKNIQDKTSKLSQVTSLAKGIKKILKNIQDKISKLSQVTLLAKGIKEISKNIQDKTSKLPQATSSIPNYAELDEDLLDLIVNLNKIIN